MMKMAEVGGEWVIRWGLWPPWSLDGVH